MDRLIAQNEEKAEIFVRTYASLVLLTFPLILKCLRSDIQRIQGNQSTNGLFKICETEDLERVTQLETDGNNALLGFVSQFLKFFFEIKLNLERLNGILKETAARRNRPCEGADTTEVDLGSLRENIAPATPQKQDENEESAEDQDEDEDQEELIYRNWAHLSCLLV